MTPCPPYSFVIESILTLEPLAASQSYCQYFYNAPATALRMLHLAAAISGDAGSLGDHLRAVEQQHQKSCDTDVGARRDVPAIRPKTVVEVAALLLCFQTHAA